MIYRIITEDKGKDKEIADLVLRHFEGFSISKQVGYYKGGKESSIVIEIDTFDDDNRLAIAGLCREIREYLSQECVLLQRIESNSRLV